MKNYLQRVLDDIYPVLETYSNVNRGSGYHSMVTTSLFEKSREIFLEFLQLSKSEYSVVFCTPRNAEKLLPIIEQNNYKRLASKDFGLPLGVVALAIKKKLLSVNVPFITGGGTTKLYSTNWVIRAQGPERWEPGTPPIINIIAFARALILIGELGTNPFLEQVTENRDAKEILYNDELKEFKGNELLNCLRKTLIGKGIKVPTSDGLKSYINLDNSASTPTFETVWRVFEQTTLQSDHVQNEIISEVRSICAESFNAPLNEYDFIFNSNTTEAITLVAETLADEPSEDIEPVILITFLEHSSNDLPWRDLTNHTILRLPVDKNGFWNVEELDKTLSDYNLKKAYGRKRIAMVAMSGASNVLGVCNDLKKTGEIVKRNGAKFLVDAAQLAAHKKVNIKECDIDYLALSGHKVYAPFGSGLLVAKKGMLQPDSERVKSAIASGEENAGGIAALGKALLLLNSIGYDIISNEEEILTKKALTGMKQIPDIKIYGIKETHHSELNQKIGVISFDIKNIPAGRVARKLSLHAGIGTRYGCHCAHIIIKYLLDFTPFLERIQRFVVLMVPPLKLQGLTRVSFGIYNTTEDIDRLLFELHRISKRENYQKKDKKQNAYPPSSKEMKMVEEQIKNDIKMIINKILPS